MNAPMTAPMVGADPEGLDPTGVNPVDVAGYVAAVRAHLDDLRPDEVEELTGGLEADLTDELEGEPVLPADRFGHPAHYAAELRAAAGLPSRPVVRSRRSGDLAALALGLREVRDRLVAPMTRLRAYPDVRDFTVTLRPLWWVLRGYVAYQLAVQLLTGGVHRVFPYSIPTWLAFLVLMVGSVELGRRGWARRGGRERLVVAVGNAFAVLLMLSGMVVSEPITLGTRSSTGFASTEVITVPPATGLYNHGYQVVNVFPYDRNGDPLRDVQLFDDRGRPLTPAEERYVGRDGVGVRLLPAVTGDGRQGYNVFPLREQVEETGATGEGTLARTPVRDAALPDPTQAPVVPIPVPSPSEPAK